MQEGPMLLPITLRDGRKIDANDLRLRPLFEALTDLGLAGIDAHMGKHELLAIYRSYIKSTAAELINRFKSIAAK